MVQGQPLPQTPRLSVREVFVSDRAFILRLLNEPSWLENIGDRGVRSEADAEGYITHNIRGPYRALGYGLYALLLKSTQLPLQTIWLEVPQLQEPFTQVVPPEQMLPQEPQSE